MSLSVFVVFPAIPRVTFFRRRRGDCDRPARRRVARSVLNPRDGNAGTDSDFPGDDPLPMGLWSRTEPTQGGIPHTHSLEHVRLNSGPTDSIHIAPLSQADDQDLTDQR